MRSLRSDSNIIWIADTNYRVDLDYKTAKALAEADDLDSLFAVDQVCDPVNIILINIDRQQLRQAMDTGTAFAGYTEGPLLFRPTYRYDVGTDHYDTSDKMRIPAWTGKHGHLQQKWNPVLTQGQIAFCTAVITWTFRSTQGPSYRVQITNQVLIFLKFIFTCHSKPGHYISLRNFPRKNPYN